MEKNNKKVLFKIRNLKKYFPIKKNLSFLGEQMNMSMLTKIFQ
ncbi:hypothetical protein ANHYDRO_01942 [Anaerococcus hydrogenalis DSM 7454]|uniref:Uncharacterized protein n=1 Tax=Anaerococcus hydrogenalis DSM 7454 TaxID=561177 RepID=B6WBF9_9FIRM|nr:hypothetical protein ANHYDRO_01942 [Anaerococcus hydrogenalis DSM 7454]